MTSDKPQMKLQWMCT